VTEPLRLNLPSSRAAIRALNEAFRALSAAHRLAPPIEVAVNLALEEAVTNIVTHGYGGREGGAIAVEIAILPGEVVVCLEDSAPPFDPLQAPEPDFATPLQQRRVGGLGVYLVKRIMDAVEYRRADGKNRLTMRKRL
jgi:anti-sigma regulatory factor (Ser/Thr protein kinase)